MHARWPALGIALLAACSGRIEGTGGASVGSSGHSGGGGHDAAGAPGIAAACTSPSVGTTPLRRLTNTEYDRTLRDLFRGFDVGTPSVTGNLPGDTALALFDNDAAHQSVPAATADGYMRAAEAIADVATADLPKLMGCDPWQAGDGCVRSFVTSFGRRAFRRPLDPAERDRLMTFFAAAKASEDVRGAVSLLVQRFLQSPQFLYRLEPATMPGRALVRVTSYELATRLSYLLWGTIPDDALLDAADRGQLSTVADVRAQADRLLGDARAHDNLRRFAWQWLGLDKLDALTKDAKLFPTFTPALAASMRQGTERLMDHLLFDANASFAELFTSGVSYADPALAAHYGVPHPPGDAFVAVMRPEGQRAGILTEASLLTLTSDTKAPLAIRRGKLVRTRLLCDELPSVPAMVPPLPAVDPNVSSRERISMHSSVPVCASCHKLMDKIGFGLEAFDAIGRPRSTDAGKPIDDSGEIVDGGDAAGPFRGAVELGRKLAASTHAQTCVARQVFTYANGRPPADEDACTVEALRTRLAGGGFRDALVALVTSDAFLLRPAGGN